jgi:hypothetical protein
MAMGVDMRMTVRMGMGMGVGWNHPEMLYYNITDVQKRHRVFKFLVVRRRAFAPSSPNAFRGAPSRTMKARLWPHSFEARRDCAMLLRV